MKKEKELKREAERELDGLVQAYQENKEPLPDDDSRNTTLKLTDIEYDRLIEAIAERNRLSDLIADTICKGCRKDVYDSE